MECPVCFNAFDAHHALPKVLKCGHSFCQECVQNLGNSDRRRLFGYRVDSIGCPQCRTACSPQEIRTNFALLEILNRRVDPAPSAPPQPAERQCTVHQLAVDAFCNTCSVFVCRTCYLASSSEHANHVRLSLEDAVAQVAGIVQNRLREVRLMRHNHVEQLGRTRKAIECLEENVAEIEMKGRSFFENLMEQLQQQHAQFNIRVLEYFERQHNAFRQKAQEIQRRGAHFEELEQKLQAAGEKGETLEAIELLAGCGEELTEGILDRIDCISLGTSPSDMNCKKLEFIPLTDQLAQVFELRTGDRGNERRDLRASVSAWSLED